MRKTNTYTIPIPTTIDIERGNSYRYPQSELILSHLSFSVFSHRREEKRKEGYNNMTKRKKKNILLFPLDYPNPALEFLTTCVTG